MWHVLFGAFLLASSADASQLHGGCPVSMKACPSRNNICLPQRWFCDGEPDCPNGEDENSNLCRHGIPPPVPRWDSPAPVVADPWPKLAPVTADPWPLIPCAPEHFLCDRACVPDSFRCNGVRECGNVDDEGFCPVTDAVVIPRCNPGEIECFTGNCILSTQLCDGHEDCRHGEDEFACAFSKNKEFTYKCIEKCIGIHGNCTSDNTYPVTYLPTTTTTTTASPLLSCDQGYTLLVDRCVTAVVFPPKSWEEARVSCQSNSASLVEIDNGKFFLELQNFLNQSRYESFSFWTGANDISHEDKWTWNPSGKPVHRGAPLWTIARTGNSYLQDPTGGTAENCGLLENCPFQYLNDQSCEKEHPYLCQKEPTERFW